MSFVGAGPAFHTPADMPENTTSPELLRQAFDAIGSAIENWLALPAELKAAPQGSASA
jgi:hypothetical protein